MVRVIRGIDAVTAGLAAGLLALTVACPAAAQPAPSRGQLLYETHCVACHDARVHWRDNKRATDWSSLRTWVRHWQGDQRLPWTDDDIDEVTRHLNDAIYRFPRPQLPRGARPLAWTQYPPRQRGPDALKATTRARTASAATT